MKNFYKNKLFLFSVGCLLIQGCSKVASQSGTSTTSTTGSTTLTRTLPTAGSVAKVTPVAQGQILGSCMYQLDSNFVATTTPSQSDISWPMLTCDAQQRATCAEGFKVINETPVQMNCATNSSTQLTNCYWGTKRCVRITGSTDASNFVRGQSYGGCLAQLNEQFAITGIDYTAWPMLSCTTAGVTTCAAGFKAVKETPVQMNCSTNPSKTNTSNCYWLTTRCAKN